MGASFAIAAVGLLAGESMSQSAAPPTPAAPPPMPTLDMTAISAASQLSINQQIARQGRMSTILSNTAATDTPATSKLGG